MISLMLIALLGADEKPLRFAVTPYFAPDELAVRYKPLTDRMSKVLGAAVHVTVASDFGTVAEMLLDGRADIAEMTPFAFVSGMQRGKLQPIAADAMVGRPGTGLIVTRANSKITSLEELKGVHFGFVDRFSSTGFLAPWANLQSRGVDPASLAYRFAGSHEAVLQQIMSGELEAGAVSRHSYGQWLEGHDAGEPFRILAETSRMPGDVVCASEHLPARQVAALTALFLGLSWDSPQDRKVLEPVTRKAYLRVDVKEYAWLLRVAASIKEPAAAAH
jgi:phosphate/phosphite/phosphonate ABC transporter binding protein